MNNELMKAFDLWIELTGLDPNSNSWSTRNWDIHKANDQIKESLSLDDTLTTTILLLRYFVDEFLAEREFTVKSILEDYETFQQYIQKSKQLTDLLNSGSAELLKKELQVNVQSAYGIVRQDVLEIVNNPDKLAFLRRDALKSMKNLQIHQFTQGNETNSKAVYFKNVYQYWNINSLIRSIAHSEKSGVSLCLIKDKTASHSYFVFAIRNGGTISLLTDKPQWVHPVQKEMNRRPGRDFSERISENHFPYSLMNITYDYRGDAFVLEDKTTLVPYQAKAIPLKEIKDLEPDEVIWTMMMFELIENKFWKAHYRTKELSYTGEMMHVKDVSEELVNALALQSHKPIQAPYVTKEDVTSENTKEMWATKPTGQYEWIEKRYEHLVSDELLNLIDNSEKLKLMPIHSTDMQSMVEMTSAELREYKLTVRNQPLVHYEALSMLEFGTKEKLLDDQRWYARYNKAKQLNMFAYKEFDETKDRIKNWYKKSVTDNAENLLRAVAEGEFVAEDFEYGNSSFEQPSIKSKNILHLYLKDDYWGYQDIGVQLWNDKDESNKTCYLTGNPILIRARFEPSTPMALAKICGCEVKDLPEVLQHWTKDEMYSGNSILQKVDPMEWVVKNPWRKSGFDVVIYLSKNGYNQIRKQFNFPPNKFWLENK